MKGEEEKLGVIVLMLTFIDVNGLHPGHPRAAFFAAFERSNERFSLESSGGGKGGVRGSSRGVRPAGHRTLVSVLVSAYQ